MAATRLLPPQDYADRLVGAVHRLPSTPIAIGDAHRRVLAEDVTARYSLPGFDNSAMDGYAVRAADVPAPGTTLPVAGVIPAGDTRQVRLEPGTAWQIMTGAAVPETGSCRGTGDARVSGSFFHLLDLCPGPAG